MRDIVYLGLPEVVEAVNVLRHVVAPIRVRRVVLQVPLFRRWEVPAEMASIRFGLQRANGVYRDTTED